MIKLLEYNMKNVFDLADIEEVCFAKDAWTVNNLRGEFMNEYSYLIGYYQDDKLVGYTCVRAMYEEAQVCNVAVLPEYRRQGIAKQLIEEMLRLSAEKGCQVCELEVNTENTPAVELYKKCGFEVAGIRKNFYRRSRYNSRDAYTMTKSLVE
ncbi:MAG: ribosomal protein S18-alanine N-acetyltransferase [Clostridia bacterium]|nr:ribosomal protein S18-alanine N-acetyltransferase [Clostridia bacterium]MBQ4272274.1 ribosomal protein S18-alanine N-acetyltransferase [Clostridia bacterium]